MLSVAVPSIVIVLLSVRPSWCTQVSGVGRSLPSWIGLDPVDGSRSQFPVQIRPIVWPVGLVLSSCIVVAVDQCRHRHRHRYVPSS